MDSAIPQLCKCQASVSLMHLLVSNIETSIIGQFGLKGQTRIRLVQQLHIMDSLAAYDNSLQGQPHSESWCGSSIADQALIMWLEPQ
jgi:hypothetical protein